MKKQSNSSARWRQHFVDKRPWGRYEILLADPHFKVKRIEIKPGARLSLQKHFKRGEKWTVVRGKGIATVNGRRIPVKEGSFVRVPRKAVHRMANTGKRPLVFIEVQLGSYFGEDDVVRLADDYNRL